MSKNNLNRRDFLKVLIASGAGLTASSLVPSKWMKPLVNTGVMPVHAQTSVQYSLEGSGEIDGSSLLGKTATLDFVYGNVWSPTIVYNDAHAKLAAPAKIPGYPVPNWPVTVKVVGPYVNCSYLSGPITNKVNTGPAGEDAEFEKIIVKLDSQGDFSFYLEFTAPNCEKFTKTYSDLNFGNK